MESTFTGWEMLGGDPYEGKVREDALYLRVQGSPPRYCPFHPLIVRISNLPNLATSGAVTELLHNKTDRLPSRCWAVTCVARTKGEVHNRVGLHGRGAWTETVRHRNARPPASAGIGSEWADTEDPPAWHSRRN